jgi:hypothetical protein
LHARLQQKRAKKKSKNTKQKGGRNK